MSPAERIRAAGLKRAAKEFGADSVITGDHLDDGLKFVPVRDLLVKARLKRPGRALGRIQNVIGYEGTSKTSMMYHEAADFWRCGGVIDIVTVERAESTEHVRHYLPPEAITFHRAKHLQEAIEMSYSIQNNYKEMDPKNEVPKFQGLDSVAAAVLEEMLEEEIEAGKKTPGGYGKIMKDFVNTMIQKIDETQTFWCALNQARDKQAIDKISAMMLQWQPPIEKMGGPGGRALPFASTYFDILEKTGRVREESEGTKLTTGISVRCTMLKNKLGSPYGTFEYNINWGEDFDYAENTVDVLASGNILGLQVAEKRYWCEEIGISERKKVKYPEMYEAMHDPANVGKFEQALGIIPGFTFPFVDTAPAPAAVPPPPTPE